MPEDVEGVEFPDVAAMLAALTHRRFIRFRPGRYGRVDVFAFEAGNPGHPPDLIAELSMWSNAETLAALTSLDQAVVYDDEIIFDENYSLWTKIANKSARNREEANAAALFERRLIEQKRVLGGEMKRGHRAFGFYPLDGGS